MNYPSVKTLSTAFGPEKGRAIRKVMLSGGFDGDKLARINDILGFYGVERIEQGRNQKSPAINYCNSGDTYRTTVMLIDGSFRVGCWGDIVERGNYA